MSHPIDLVIDIGGTWIRIGHLEEDEAQPLEHVSTDGLRSADPLGFLEGRIRNYLDTHEAQLRSLMVGVPFTPDANLEKALSSPNIRELEGLPMRSMLEERLGVPVRLERDINLLLLGEWSVGAAKGYGNVFGAFFGTGVGACYLEQGKPFRGATGSAVELGHIPIRGEGRQCVCGNTDCLEAYACGHTLNLLSERYNQPVAELFVNPTRHPSELQQALQEFVRDQAFAMATAVNLFQPHLALVGGGVPRMKGFPQEEFKRIFYNHLRRPVPAETVAFAWAELGSQAALYGARALVPSKGHLHESPHFQNQI